MWGVLTSFLIPQNDPDACRYILRLNAKDLPISNCEHLREFYVISVPQFNANSKLNFAAHFFLEGSFVSVFQAAKSDREILGAYRKY